MLLVQLQLAPEVQAACLGRQAACNAGPLQRYGPTEAHALRVPGDAGAPPAEKQRLDKAAKSLRRAKDALYCNVCFVACLVSMCLTYRARPLPTITF